MARYALVIGIGNNQHPFNSLSKTVGDAQAIAQVLKEHGNFDVQLLVKPQEVQYKALETAILEFVRQRATGDEALIYYAGHGFTLVKDFGQEEAFLAPADCNISIVEGKASNQSKGLSLASLSALLAKESFSNLMMLIDCCHSGYVIESNLLRKTFTDPEKDYWLLTACRSFESAWAEKDDPHSVFTGAVLAGLQHDRADDHGVITVGSLFEFVQRTLRQQHQEQEPLQLSVGRSIEPLRFPLAQSAAAVDENVEPYQGLKAFTPATAKFFFGRIEEVQNLCLGRESYAQPEAIAYCPSGCKASKTGNIELVSNKLWGCS